LQGVLAQAKNGEELFWEEKFHAPNQNAQACTQVALLFFSFKFGVGSKRRVVLKYFIFNMKFSNLIKLFQRHALELP
jgi:hypothetical protein